MEQGQTGAELASPESLQLHESPWLTLREAAAYVRTSPRFISNRIRDGSLPAARLGDGPRARIRVRREDVDGLLGVAA